MSLAGLLLVVVMTAIAIWQISESPGTISEGQPVVVPTAAPGGPVAVTVELGQSPGEIGDMLEALGVIDSGDQFKTLVALLGYDRVLQAGEYEFDLARPALEVVYSLRQGEVATRIVTVLEGWRLEQVADALAEQGIPRQEFLAAARVGQYDFDFLAGLEPEQSLEGFLFPAIYVIGPRDTASDFVQEMLQAFDESVPQSLREQATQGDLTLLEILTIASVVEREAQLERERPIIAQVFLTRLSLGMPLEADATVQYAIAADPDSVAQFGYWKQGLTEADLAVDSPYNTYAVPALPPGPIGNPGLASIVAVIRPADTGYLFFVATSDGSHAFAETFDEHLENVRRYLGQ